jgi:hypothetical protein
MKKFFNFIDKLPYLIKEIVYLLLISLEKTKILTILGFTGRIYNSEYGIDLNTTKLNLNKFKLRELSVNYFVNLLTNPEFAGDSLGTKYICIFNDKGQLIILGTCEVTIELLYSLNSTEYNILLHDLVMMTDQYVYQCNQYVNTKPWWWKLNGGGFFYMHISDKNIFNTLNKK